MVSGVVRLLFGYVCCPRKCATSLWVCNINIRESRAPMRVISGEKANHEVCAVGGRWLSFKLVGVFGVPMHAIGAICHGCVCCQRKCATTLWVCVTCIKEEVCNNFSVLGVQYQYDIKSVCPFLFVMSRTYRAYPVARKKRCKKAQVIRLSMRLTRC